MAQLTILDKNNFKTKVAESNLPIFIDMWAEWCRPCKKIEPVVKELADEYAGKMRFGKLNIDENQELAMKYGVMSIPMFMIMDNDSNILHSFVGAVPKAKFIEHIETVLKKQS